MSVAGVVVAVENDIDAIERSRRYRRLRFPVFEERPRCGHDLVRGRSPFARQNDHVRGRQPKGFLNLAKLVRFGLLSFGHDEDTVVPLATGPPAGKVPLVATAVPLGTHGQSTSVVMRG
jgi:hypothetical protein